MTAYREIAFLLAGRLLTISIIGPVMIFYCKRNFLAFAALIDTPCICIFPRFSAHRGGEGSIINAIYRVSRAAYGFFYEMGGKPPSLNVETTSLNVIGRLSRLSKIYTGVLHASACDMKQLNYPKVLSELKTKMVPELTLLLPMWVQHPTRIVGRYNTKTSEIDGLFRSVLGETVRQVLGKKMAVSVRINAGTF